MSRGLGKWERTLAHAVYFHPRVAKNGRRHVFPADYATSRSEYISIQRAARSLIRKRIVSVSGYWANDLMAAPDVDDISVYTCTDCHKCKHLGGAS